MYTKKSITLGVIFLALVLASFGLISFGLETDNWLRPVALIFGAVILFLEVGIKKLTPLSSLKKLGMQQYVVLTVAFLSLLNGILTLPVIDITVDFLDKSAGVVMLLSSIGIIVELFTNK